MKKYKKLSIVLIIIAVAVFAVIGIVEINDNSNRIENSASANNIEKTESINSEDLKAGYDLEIINIGSYTGPYMEDGSDEEVTDILTIEIKNTGHNDIQYGEITLSAEGEEDASFRFSTLESGHTVKVLEANKKPYEKSVKYIKATALNVAFFTDKLTIFPQKLKIQGLDGGLNVTNVSNQDIDGEIAIYFKDCEGDMLMGGITYRGRIEGGLKAGEIRQLMSENFTANNTKVMFVTINEK